ncbi:MAG: T9SS type A sorting domain-containing protein [Janthinobacterium lividum]
MKNKFASHRNKTSVSRLPLVTGWGLALGAWLLACPLAQAQAPNWQAAWLAGGNAYSQVTGIATDASGNVYVAGSFSNATMTLGAITLTNTVTSGSTVGMSRDAFVAKWSPISGTFVWAQKAGGTTDYDAAKAIAVSGTSVYVVATLTGSGFGGAAANGGDYLIKFTDAGGLSWAQPAGITVAGLAASGTSVYLAGNFSGTASLGSLSLTSVGSADVAVAKLTDAGSTGSFVWAQRAGSSGYDNANALAVVGATLYITTGYSAAASFGATQLAAVGSAVVKLTDAGATGSFGWVQPVAAATFDRLAVGAGRLYATGRILGTAAFGTTTLTSSSAGGSFVAALTDGGSTATFGWAQQLSDPTGNTAIHTVAASGPAVYIAGSQRGALSFGATTLPGPLEVGLFVARLTDAGTAASYDWAVPATAYFSAYQHSLALYRNAVYLAGMLAGPVVFGGNTLPASGGPVAFLASLADETALASTPSTALAGLEVSPNPAHGTVMVRVPAGVGAATLTLLDALGRTVRTQATSASIASPLNLTGLAPGMYALRVQAGEALAVRQLVVE